MKDDDGIPYQVIPRAVTAGTMPLGVQAYLRSQKIKEGATSIPFAPRVRTPRPQSPIASSSLRRK